MKKISLILIIFSLISGVFFRVEPFVHLAHADDVSSTDFSEPDYTDRLEECGVIPGMSGSFEGCLIRGFYYIVLVPSGWFASLAGSLFDYFVQYSIDSTSYKGGNGQFVEQGWTLIRDIANIIFIFTLLYIAIRHILQMGNSDTKRLLTSLIVAALLINFSLFFTRVIIDSGNILARAFYNNIDVQNDVNPDQKSISAALIGKVNPQKVLGSNLFTPQYVSGESGSAVLSPGYSFFIMAIAALVNITIGIVFLSTFLLFVARVIGLWFMMIFSPIAFASRALPGEGKFLGQFGWSGWLDTTLKLSFMAPVFLFFLFLLIMFLQIVFSAAPDADSTHKLMDVMIPFIVIIVVLNRAKKISNDMAGEFGSALKSAVSKTAGYTLGAAGLALGGAAIASRYTVGRAAASVSRSERVANMRQSDNFFTRNLGKFIDTTAKKGANASFDARNTGVFRRSTSLLQATAGAATGEKAEGKVFGLDGLKGGGKGGYRHMEEETKKKALESAKKMDMEHEESSSYRKAELKRKNLEAQYLKDGVTDYKEKDDYKKAEAEVKKAKAWIDSLNKSRRKGSAAWQRAFFWEAGAREAASAVERGDKPKGETDKLLKELREKMKKEDAEHGHGDKKGGDGHGGGHKEEAKSHKEEKHEEKHEEHPPAGGGGGHDDHGGGHH